MLHEYLFAKRRFRHFSQRDSREKRFPRRNWSMRFSSGKGKNRKGSSGFGKGKGYHFGGSVITPGSLAGGKGKGRGKSKKGGKHFMAGSPGATNPRGQDGSIMRCHECDSETHLVAACPKRKGGKGKGKGGKHFLAWDSGSAAAGPQPQGAPAYAPAPAQPRTGVLTGALHWYVGDVRIPGASTSRS